jgi:pimeloyl-ACP methyl ester carboxylesterase
MDEAAILSRGARLNALIYRAAGEGLHPVAVFLHGFPGNEKNLDLAQAVRRAGWDAVYFDYRGSWGSGGTFSFANSLEDVAAALAWVRDPAHAAKHRFDTGRIAIVGHSFGGWLALLTARREPPPVCVAALAAWNLRWTSRHLDDAGVREEGMKEFRDATDPAGGPLRTTADALMAELAAAPAGWDYLSDVSASKGRALLLVAATRDTPDEDPAMHARLERAVREAGGTLVKSVTFEDDHSFSASRLRLAELLVDWLNGDCGASQKAAR